MLAAPGQLPVSSPDELTSAGLTELILPLIEAGVDAELPEFNEIAMKLFRFQYDNNALFHEFANAKGVHPGDIDSWRDVPTVYNDVFKTHLVASFPLEQSVMGCLTGGTTSLTQRGRIFRDEDGKKLVFTANRIMTGAYLFPDFEEGMRCRILVLAPSPEFAPSMGMAIGMQQTIEAFGTDDSMFLLKRSGIDVQKLIAVLRESESTGVPVALIGATSAFVFFFQACRRDGRTFNLPAGSRVCDGGGYRGRFGVVTRDDYYEMVEEILGVPNHYCVNALGEAETATNLFDDALRRHVKGLPAAPRTRPVPPWSRVISLSIDYLTPIVGDEVGLLAHWDLANVPTVLAILTDNLGHATADGRSCDIVGRAKLEDGRVSVLPDEERPMGAMGDTAIFRMLERYVNFSIDLKTRFAKDPGSTPGIREEIESRPGSVASCRQVVDEILDSQADEEAARMRDEALDAFKAQTERPIDWFIDEFEIQNIEQPSEEEQNAK